MISRREAAYSSMASLANGHHAFLTQPVPVFAILPCAVLTTSRYLEALPSVIEKLCVWNSAKAFGEESQRRFLREKAPAKVPTGTFSVAEVGKQLRDT
jgi:hypothetical protein